MHARAQAFSGVLSNELRAGSWQQRRALQETFKTLLGPHYKPVLAAAASAGASSSAERKHEHEHEQSPQHEHEHEREQSPQHGHEHEHDSSDGEVSVRNDPPDDADMYYDSAWDSDCMSD